MKLKMQPTSLIITRLGLNPDGDTQQFFTNACALRMENYVPYRGGDLSKTAVIDGEVNSKNVHKTYIVYNQNYARYVYYGLSRTGKEMHYTDVPHKDAGPYWDREMINNEEDMLIKDVENYLRYRRGAK